MGYPFAGLLESTMPDNSQNQTPVAIIGMGCIFANSKNLKDYLRLVMGGIDGISDPPPSHAYLNQYFDPDPRKADHIYCTRGGFIPYTDFDPTEFGIPPSALEATDTSQLLALITAKKALEDAGYGADGKTFDHDRTSVILGVTGTQELVIPLGARLGYPLWHQALAEAAVPPDVAQTVVRNIADGYVPWQENSFPGLLGNVVAGRIANRLDLNGTNCVVDAACASSMGAIYMALLELETHRSEMVITGGVDTINDAFMHMCFAKTQILSPTGDIRPFSKDADGTVLGEGVGLLVLKRLSDAQRDNDRIYAVIKGIGSASDGKSQSIYAPRAAGQKLAITRAYEKAAINPTQVGLIEAHGTGTRVGDNVEFQSLHDIFKTSHVPDNQCALGSVKSNIGHTKAAAGTAGLIKATLSLYHKLLPPTLKAEIVDPKLNVTQSPFYINQELRPWLASDKKRTAGVSAFGFGGSNFHVVLEEYESKKSAPSWDGSVEIIAFSADSKNALNHKTDQWFQIAENDIDQGGLGLLAAITRHDFDANEAKRLLLVLPGSLKKEQLGSVHDATRVALSSPGQDISGPHGNLYFGEGPQPGELAFIFPGQGSQYVGMGRQIVGFFPESLAAFEEASLYSPSDGPLDELIYPRTATSISKYESRLRSTQYAQPALGAVSVAMTRVLHYFGLQPYATCGHSYGELVALHAAGWISQTELWRLSEARGRLMSEACAQTNGHGGMLAVVAPIQELAQLTETFSKISYWPITTVPIKACCQARKMPLRLQTKYVPKEAGNPFHCLWPGPSIAI